MNPWAIVGIVVTVLLFLVAHLGAAVWFASRINTEMGMMRGAMVELKTDVRSLVAMDKRVAFLERDMSALQEQWRTGRWFGTRSGDHTE